MSSFYGDDTVELSLNLDVYGAQVQSVATGADVPGRAKEVERFVVAGSDGVDVFSILDVLVGCNEPHSWRMLGFVAGDVCFRPQKPSILI